MIEVPKHATRLTVEIEGWLEFGCPAHALRKLEQLAKIPGARPALLMLRVRAHVDLARYQEALDDLNELRDFGHDAEACDVTEAWCLKRLDRLEEAAQVMRRLIGRQPRSAIGHFNLGCYLALLGQPEQALDQLTVACGIDPSFRKHLADERDLDSLMGMSGFEDLKPPQAED